MFFTPLQLFPTVQMFGRTTQKGKVSGRVKSAGGIWQESPVNFLASLLFSGYAVLVEKVGLFLEKVGLFWKKPYFFSDCQVLVV